MDLVNDLSRTALFVHHFLIAESMSSRSFYSPHHDEGPFSVPLFHGIGLLHVAGISEDRLAKGKVNETRLGEMIHDLVNGVEGRILVKRAFVLALQVLPAERALRGR